MNLCSNGQSIEVMNADSMNMLSESTNLVGDVFYGFFSAGIQAPCQGLTIPPMVYPKLQEFFLTRGDRPQASLTCSLALDNFQLQA